MKTTDKQKQYMRDYYEKHKEEILEKSKIYHQKNKEAIKERTRNYINSHQELVKRYQAGYRAKWYLKKKLGILSHYSNGSMVCAHCGFEDMAPINKKDTILLLNQMVKSLKQMF